MRLKVSAPMALEGVREVEGRVEPTARTSRAARDLLAATRLRCQKGGREHSGLGCIECARFVNYRPSPDRSNVTVRCQWSADDPVAELMTLASELDTIDVDTRVAEADDFAQRRGHRHLLVTRGDELVGVVCRCDLVPPVLPGELVSDRMRADLVCLPADASLGDAALVMTELEVGCLPVVDRDGLCGVVTRGDLRRAGAGEALLGAARCAACGSAHGVRPHPTLEAVEFCLDCLDRAMTPADYAELGAGD